MTSLRCAIAAAGRGTRSGLQGPKTLALVGGKPIVVRLLEILKPFDPSPLIIVSPEGKPQIESVVQQYGLQADFVVQPNPSGMGDAVLQIAEAAETGSLDDVLLLWGDLPFVQQDTLHALVALHRAGNNTMSLATRHVDECYTYIVRDHRGRVTRVVETREEPAVVPAKGERDTGIFVFRREAVLNCLRSRGLGAIGRTTGEHGFLYVVSQLVDRGLTVEGYPIAGELEVLGFNTPADLAEINERAQ